MSESEATLDYFEKFAYTPTQLSNGSWTWWRYYWVKSIHYEPSLKEMNSFGYPTYTRSVYTFLNQKEYEIDQMLHALKGEDNGSVR